MNRCENHGDTKDGSSQLVQVQAMEFTYYYASIYFEAVNIFFIKKPKELPRGYITSFLVGATIIGIFLCLTILGIARMLFGPKTNKKKRRRKRSVEAISRWKSKHRNDAIFDSKEAEENDTFHDCRNILDSEGAPEIFQACHDTLHSEGDDTIDNGPSNTTRIFTTCLADVDQETLNTQVLFDTDSIFFVYDNSSTGHICNDISKLVPGTI